MGLFEFPDRLLKGKGEYSNSTPVGQWKALERLRLVHNTYMYIVQTALVKSSLKI